MKFLIKKYILLSVLFVVNIGITVAQCPMCKTALGSARESGSSVGNTLNDGIMYLLALPYLIGIIFAIIYYNNSRKKKLSGQ
jgi:hypothetical protein